MKSEGRGKVTTRNGMLFFMANAKLPNRPGFALLQLGNYSNNYYQEVPRPLLLESFQQQPHTGNNTLVQFNALPWSISHRHYRHIHTPRILVLPPTLSCGGGANRPLENRGAKRFGFLGRGGSRCSGCAVLGQSTLKNRRA